MSNCKYRTSAAALTLLMGCSDPSATHPTWVGPLPTIVFKRFIPAHTEHATIDSSPWPGEPVRITTTQLPDQFVLTLKDRNLDQTDEIVGDVVVSEAEYRRVQVGERRDWTTTQINMRD